MINIKQFREQILRPALQELSNNNELWSTSAEELLVATCAQESLGGTYVIQTNGVRNGGIGIFQVEKRTYDDLWEHFIPSRGTLKRRIMSACNFSVQPEAIEMVCNLKFATMMARIFYLRIKAPLPPANDLDKMFDYYKKYYNTIEGDATKDQFLTNYKRFTGKTAYV